MQRIHNSEARVDRSFRLVRPFQASGRGGVVKVRVVKDRVLLGGRAVTVAKGELLVEGDEP